MKQLDGLMEALERFTGQEVTLSWINTVINLAFSLIAFVILAMALYPMARRRGFHKTWTAWVPVVNSWLVGGLSDQYRAVNFGQGRSRRKLLLWLSISHTVLLILMEFVAIRLMLKMWRLDLLNPALLENLPAMSDAELMAMMQQILLPSLCLMLLALAFFSVYVVYLVFFYIALSDIFKSCDPYRAKVYTILSIAAGLGMNLILGLPLMLMPGIFLFALRHADLGMPPRQTCLPQ